MCGYRIWGLAAAFIGYFITFFIIDFFGLEMTSEEKRNTGFAVGLAIYFIPLLLFSLGGSSSSTTTSSLPNLSEAEVERITPFTAELVQRVNAGEKIEIVAQSIAVRAKVSQNQVIAYSVVLAQALKEKPK